MRNPAGPSAITIAGMPSLGISYVVPAAPSTRSCVSPTTGSPGVEEGFIVFTTPGMFIPLPVTKYAFSSSVMAAITFLTGSLPSLGASAQLICMNATMPRTAIKRQSGISDFVHMVLLIKK